MSTAQIPCLLTVTVTFVLAAAETDDAEEVAQPDATLTAFDSSIIAFFAFCCALLLSFFGVLLGYFSIKEDTLLRRYQREGIRVRAAVDTDTIQYTRHFVSSPPSSPRCCCQRDEDDGVHHREAMYQECLLIIEYRSIDPNPQTFTKRVRKQVRAQQSDFEVPSTWSPPLVPAVQFDLLPEEKHISFEGPVPAHEHPMDHGLELDVLQLPHHKKSGIPLKQVLRACSWKYRMPTIIMVIIIELFAAFCILFAVDMSANVVEEHVDVLVWTSALVSSLLTCEILLTRIWCEKYMNSALQQEYIEGGGMLLDYGDSGSLSSGDDSFLGPRRWGLASHFSRDRQVTSNVSEN